MTIFGLLFVFFAAVLATSVDAYYSYDAQIVSNEDVEVNALSTDIPAGRTVTGGVLFGNAIYANNRYIAHSSVVSRPLIGNIRGDSLVRVTTSNASITSNAVRTRMTIRSLNSNGTLNSEITVNWQTTAAQNDRGQLQLCATSMASTGAVFGTTRYGRITAQSERRAFPNSSWGSNLTTTRDW